MPTARVLASFDREILVLLQDGSTRWLAGAGRPGDFVALAPDGSVAVIAPYRSQRPFPCGETFRLGAGRLARLLARDRIVRRVREHFFAAGFVEVETPIHVRSPGLEVHLDAVSAAKGWLITSPEYHMKRLLAGGMGRIFQICKCFRRGEVGAHHNPEFTMIEWYRAPGAYEEIMDDCDRLLGALLPLGENRPALSPPAERISMREAFARFAGQGLPADAESFFPIFLDKIDPRLGRERPTLLYEWPAYLGALARRKSGDPEVVERFELYAGGLELANAFGELVDPVEQRARLLADQAERQRLGKEVYPIDEPFLSALDEGLPPCAGIALGLDRLVMLLLGARNITEVLAFADGEG